MLDSRYDSGGAYLVPTVTVVRAIFLILVCSTSLAWGESAIAGSVKTLQGGVVVQRGAQTISATEGMHLMVDDILRTSPDGRLGAILQDGTRIGLGPNTELKIDSFVYQPADGKLSLILRLARGVMAYVSGRIARLAPGAVTVETPVGVMGLRGTHMAISIGGI
jgi:hypothetical protein